MTRIDSGVKVLDCTFRDGGYYTNWDFDNSLVQQYVLAVNLSGISHVEIGFRNFPSEQYRGAFYYSHDEYIQELGFNSEVNLYVMVDASAFSELSDISASVKKLFQDCKRSPINGVRIAARVDELDVAIQVIGELKALGYLVCLNIMQIASLSDEEIETATKKVSPGSVEALYFADSLGEMAAEDVKRVTSAIRSSWNGEIGIHAHNNRGLALANTIAAVNLGVKWLDATMSGMGRGAGNAELENLLLELPGLLSNSKPVFNFVLSNFEPMKKKYGWGSSFLYGLAARKAIHPTFMQEMLSRDGYSISRILDIVDSLSNVNARKYDERLLTFSASSGLEISGTWNAENWCFDREVLIIGGGKTVQQHSAGVNFYIRTYKPLVISLSVIASDIFDEYIDAYACGNQTKMTAEGRHYSRTKKPVMIPLKLLKLAFSGGGESGNFRDYGMKVEAGKFEPGVESCVIPSESSLAFALALACIGGAKAINLVGFDGFGVDDIRTCAMNKLFSVYQEKGWPTLTALTPTKYDIGVGSLYSTLR